VSTTLAPTDATVPKTPLVVVMATDIAGCTTTLDFEHPVTARHSGPQDPHRIGLVMTHQPPADQSERPLDTLAVGLSRPGEVSRESGSDHLMVETPYRVVVHATSRAYLIGAGRAAAEYQARIIEAVEAAFPKHGVQIYNLQGEQQNHDVLAAQY
jgi:hypothetical protein